MTNVKQQHPKPNIVLIVLDAVRRDHLSCYGHVRPTTPQIDRIAGEGIQFMRAYATSCWTIPAHASLFTGLYPSQHRADFDTKYLDPNHTTLASYLKSLGYRTACIASNSFVSDLTNLTHGFDFSIDVEQLRGGPNGLGPRLIRSMDRRWRKWTRRDRGGQRATQSALEWLNAHDPAKPFFLFLHYMDCHLPYQLRPPERYHFVAGEDRQRVDRVPQDPFAYTAGKLSLSAQDLRDLQTIYDGCLYYLDQQIGLIEAHLQERGLYEQTIFIITSDHGESFGEHGLMDHQYGLYEPLLAVPMVMRLPGDRMTGQKCDQLVQHVDLFPTIFELVGNPVVESDRPVWSGCSMLKEPGRDAVLAEYLVPNVQAIRRRFPGVGLAHYEVAMRSIYTDGHKLIWRSDGDLELYNLDNDPAERTNLVDGQADLARQLQTRLQQQLGPWPGLVANGLEDDGMDQVRDRLEALGYF